MMFNCHCRDCQQVGGGPYHPVLVVSLADFKLSQGTLKRYASTRLTGRSNLRGFCSDCGSTLTAGEDPDRNRIGLIAASLDDPSWFKPSVDIFIGDAQPWNTLDASLPKHQHYMPRG